jgi:hypothetical protein
MPVLGQYQAKNAWDKHHALSAGFGTKSIF